MSSIGPFFDQRLSTGMLLRESMKISLLIAKAAEAVKLDPADFSNVVVKTGHKPLINFVPENHTVILILTKGLIDDESITTNITN
jgi:hypothetical protein